ncbi:Hsp70 family protein [Glycomyces tarimensis]
MTRPLAQGTSLGIDFGTSHTVAVVSRPDGSVRPLLIDGSPLMPSAVCADTEGGLLVGRDAVHGGRRFPERFEPNPKRHIDRPSILLGDRELGMVEVIGAVLGAVTAECRRVVGEPRQVTITVPAEWGPSRRQVIEDAAATGGLDRIRLVPEPVAAATYFADALEHHIAMGSSLVVYDLGAGTFDASVVRRTSNGFETVALDGRADLGGLDIDAALIDHLAETYGPHSQWRRLTNPATVQERRGFREFLEEVRGAKERLSRHQQADFTIPLLDVDAHLTRAELESVAAPLLEQTIRVTRAVIRAAGIDIAQSAGVFLVGGASRMPLVATMLHRALGIAPTVLEQPEVVVAEGSVLHAEPVQPAATPRADRLPPPERTPLPGRSGDSEPTLPDPPTREQRRNTRKIAIAGLVVGVLAAAALFVVFRPDDPGAQGEIGTRTGTDAENGSEVAAAITASSAGDELGEALQAHDGPVAAITSIETDDSVVLFTSGYEDGTVKQWDITAGELLGEADFDEPIMLMEPLRFSDGRTRIAAVDAAGGVHVWLPDDFEPEVVNEGAGIDESMLSLGLLEHDGVPVLAAASRTGMALYDLDERAPVSLVNYDGDPELSFDHAQVLQSEGASVVVAADPDGTLHRYDPETGDRLGNAFGPEDPGAYGTTWTDGAVVEGLELVYHDGVPYGLLYDGAELHRWNLERREQPEAGTIPLPDEDYRLHLQVIEVGGWPAVLIARGEKGVDVRNFQTGERQVSDAGWAEVSASAVGTAEIEDHTIAITGSLDGTVHLWSLGP